MALHGRRRFMRTVVGAGFEQQNGNSWIFRETRCQGRARRTRANDDVVVHLLPLDLAFCGEWRKEIACDL